MYCIYLINLPVSFGHSRIHTLQVGVCLPKVLDDLRVYIHYAALTIPDTIQYTLQHQ